MYMGKLKGERGFQKKNFHFEMYLQNFLSLIEIIL